MIDPGTGATLRAETYVAVAARPGVMITNLVLTNIVRPGSAIRSSISSAMTGTAADAGRCFFMAAAAVGSIAGNCCRVDAGCGADGMAGCAGSAGSG